MGLLKLRGRPSKRRRSPVNQKSRTSPSTHPILTAPLNEIQASPVKQGQSMDEETDTPSRMPDQPAEETNEEVNLENGINRGSGDGEAASAPKNAKPARKKSRQRTIKFATQRIRRRRMFRCRVKSIFRKGYDLSRLTNSHILILVVDEDAGVHALASDGPMMNMMKQRYEGILGLIERLCPRPLSPRHDRIVNPAYWARQDRMAEEERMRMTNEENEERALRFVLHTNRLFGTAGSS